jgi:hypothetical protein
MRIIESDLENKDIEEFRHHLFIGNSKVEINNKHFIKVLDDKENIITIAIITLPSKENVSDIINKNMYYLIEDNDTTEINNLHEMMDDRVYLDAIYSFSESNGGAKELVKYLENKYNYIWIYAFVEAEEFWEHLGWKEIIEHVYINKEVITNE